MKIRGGKREGGGEIDLELGTVTNNNEISINLRKILASQNILLYRD